MRAGSTTHEYKAPTSDETGSIHVALQALHKTMHVSCRRFACACSRCVPHLEYTRDPGGTRVPQLDAQDPRERLGCRGRAIVGQNADKLLRRVRGGSRYSGTTPVRVAFRDFYQPVIRGSSLGFRLARTVP